MAGYWIGCVVSQILRNMIKCTVLNDLLTITQSYNSLPYVYTLSSTIPRNDSIQFNTTLLTIIVAGPLTGLNLYKQMLHLPTVYI